MVRKQKTNFATFAPAFVQDMFADQSDQPYYTIIGFTEIGSNARIDGKKC